MSHPFKLSLIVVFTAFAVLMLTPQLPSSRKAHARYGVGSFTTAIDVFRMTYGRFPTSEEGLTALVERPASIPPDRWRGPRLESDQSLRDPWGRNYAYRIPGIHNPNGYDVYSLGPNGKGGDEAIGNWTQPKP